MRPGETLSLTVMLPNEQRIEVREAVVRWSRGQEIAVENLLPSGRISFAVVERSKADRLLARTYCLC
jgi:hypothetical protein